MLFNQSECRILIHYLKKGSVCRNVIDNLPYFYKMKYIKKVGGLQELFKNFKKSLKKVFDRGHRGYFIFLIFIVFSLTNIFNFSNVQFCH